MLKPKQLERLTIHVSEVIKKYARQAEDSPPDDGNEVGINPILTGGVEAWEMELAQRVEEDDEIGMSYNSLLEGAEWEILEALIAYYDGGHRGN